MRLIQSATGVSDALWSAFRSFDFLTSPPLDDRWTVRINRHAAGVMYVRMEARWDTRRARILTDLSDYRIRNCRPAQCFHYTKGKCWFKGGETK